MPENQDKKINYKILTAEEILKEAQVPAKEIEHREEKIEVPITKRIEPTPTPIKKIEEKTEVIRTEKAETGTLSPETKEELIRIKPIISSIPKIEKEIEGSPSIVGQPTEKEIELKPQSETQPKENLEAEIFYFPSKEKELTVQETKKPPIVEKKEKPKLKLKLNLNYFLIPGVLIIILALTFFLKPYERIRILLESKKPQKGMVTTTTQISFPTVTTSTLAQKESTTTTGTPTTTTTTITTTTQISFPTVTTSTVTKKESTTTITTTQVYFSTITTSTLAQNKISTTTKTSTITTSSQISFPTVTTSTVTKKEKAPLPIKTPTTVTPTQVSLPKIAQKEKIPTTVTTSVSQEKKIEILPSKEIELPGTFQTVQKNEFQTFLAKQESFGTKLNINLVDNGQKLPVNFLFDYFIKSDNSQELKNELTGNYGFLIYYGYVRKYPILVFEVKDQNKVSKFNQNWEKTTMKNDLQTLFLGFKPPKTTNTFQTKSFNEFFYRILNFGDNYKIIWAMVNNYLIYSTTETGIKEVINYLK